MVRKETRLGRAIRLTKKAESKNKIIKRLGKSAEKHFDKIGKSKNNLHLVKFRYKFKVNGKSKEQYFSAKIARIKNKAQLKRFMEITIESFQSRLETYANKGFSDISIDGVMVQGYKDEE